jgi:hypothetical protein
LDTDNLTGRWQLEAESFFFPPGKKNSVYGFVQATYQWVKRLPFVVDWLIAAGVSWLTADFPYRYECEIDSRAV